VNNGISKPPRTPKKKVDDDCKSSKIPTTPSGKDNISSTIKLSEVCSTPKKTPRSCFKGSFTPKTPCSPTVNRLYSVIQGATGSLGGNGYNGPIYGELTRVSMQRIIAALKEKCQLGIGSSFIDIGSGLGKPCFHVAEDSQCELSVGIEMEKIRYQLSIHNQRSILKDIFSSKSSKNNEDLETKGICTAAKRIFFIHGNALSPKTFNPFTHIFMCDIGFPPETLKKLGETFNRSASPYLICCHNQKLMIEKYKYNVELMEQFKISLSGSGENHTIYIYKRDLSKYNQTGSLGKLDGSLRIEEVDPFWAKAVELARLGGNDDMGSSLMAHVENEYLTFTGSERRTRSSSAKKKLEF